jgi:hypothetical protein
MNTYRGGVGLATVPLVAPATPEESVPRTRCGYKPNDVVTAFQKALMEAGSYSTGRCLHFAADLVCSGGIPVFFRLLWDYALTHIGIASPRVFVYLRQRIADLEGILKRLPDEVATGQEEFQKRIGEMILVLREAPQRTAIPWPKVGSETHDGSWMRATLTEAVTETAAVRIVWRPEGDLSLLRTAGNYLCRAISEGSTEKALFWVKWLLEEEVLTRKETKGATLSTIDRGPATLSSRQRRDVSFFIVQLFGEIYKELAAKGAVRMNEEFNALVNLWCNPPKGLGATAKKQILALLTQILCEVPRWKVPAAPALIADPIFISNAVKQVPKFFGEVLAYAPVKQPHLLLKCFKTRGALEAGATKKAKAADAVSDKMSAMDAALAAYFGGSL